MRAHQSAGSLGRATGKNARRLMTAAALSMALVTTACGSDGSGGDEDAAGAVDDITITFPFASCLAWWPFYVAQEEGFFEDEGLTPKFEGLDGAGAALQAVLSGRAQVAVTSPDNFMNAVAEGADLTGYYGVYTGQTFNLIVPADSGITSLDQLEGETVGTSAVGSGDSTYAASLLKLGADLDKDSDWTELVVGDGGQAAAALKDGTIAAYSASYFDEEVIKASGMEVTRLGSDDYPQAPGNTFVSQAGWFDDNGDAVERLGRALAQGTDVGLNDPDRVLDVCQTAVPEEVQDDPEFAKNIISEVSELVEPVDGKYGYVDEDQWDAYRDAVIGLGTVKDGASDVTIDNQYVDAWNQ